MMSEEIELHSDEVHIWRASLTQPAFGEHFWRMLAADEQERADRYPSELHRARFIASRGVQRDVLARYVGTTPRRLEFGYSPHGKPYLTGVAATAGLSFNLSNSSDLVVCAVRRGPAVGVDIELVRRLHSAEAIAERFFSAEAQRAVLDASADDRMREFFWSWVRTEARVKAVGETVWSRLGAAALERDRSLPDAPESGPVPRAESDSWHAFDLEMGNGFVGALVAEGTAPLKLRYFDWSAPLTA